MSRHRSDPQRELVRLRKRVAALEKMLRDSGQSCRINSTGEKGLRVGCQLERRLDASRARSHAAVESAGVTEGVRSRAPKQSRSQVSRAASRLGRQSYRKRLETEGEDAIRQRAVDNLKPYWFEKQTTSVEGFVPPVEEQKPRAIEMAADASTTKDASRASFNQAGTSSEVLRLDSPPVPTEQSAMQPLIASDWDRINEERARLQAEENRRFDEAYLRSRGHKV